MSMTKSSRRFRKNLDCNNSLNNHSFRCSFAAPHPIDSLYMLRNRPVWSQSMQPIPSRNRQESILQYHCIARGRRARRIRMGWGFLRRTGSNSSQRCCRIQKGQKYRRIWDLKGFECQYLCMIPPGEQSPFLKKKNLRDMKELPARAKRLRKTECIGLSAHFSPSFLLYYTIY